MQHFTIGRTQYGVRDGGHRVRRIEVDEAVAVVRLHHEFQQRRETVHNGYEVSSDESTAKRQNVGDSKVPVEVDGEDRQEHVFVQPPRQFMFLFDGRLPVQGKVCGEPDEFPVRDQEHTVGDTVLGPQADDIRLYVIGHHAAIAEMGVKGFDGDVGFVEGLRP